MHILTSGNNLGDIPMVWCSLFQHVHSSWTRNIYWTCRDPTVNPRSRSSSLRIPDRKRKDDSSPFPVHNVDEVGMMLGLQGSKLGDLQAFCRRNKVKTLSVFGSRARGDAGEI